MPPLLKFLLRRLISLPISLLIITAILYAVVMISPPASRADLYMPANIRPGLSEERVEKLRSNVIQSYKLNDPYPKQYIHWLSRMLLGDWGYSPTLNENVLEALVSRTPATLELTLYALLFFIPLGLISGVIASEKPLRLQDNSFRFFAFIGTSIPPFILALVLLSIFYVTFQWFPPERLNTLLSLEVNKSSYHVYTGLLTIDGLLNGRIDITLDAFRHLVLPVITLSMVHWATLGRVMRAAMLEEKGKDYAIAAMARGLSKQTVTWKHTFRNALGPALTSSALSAASLLTGVYVVEAVFNYRGISEVIISAMAYIPDAPAALGFTVYSIILILLLMLVLDLIQAAFNPRFREGITQ